MTTFYFQQLMGAKIAIQAIHWTRDFSSIRFPIQGVTYPQKHSKWTVTRNVASFHSTYSVTSITTVWLLIYKMKSSYCCNNWQKINKVLLHKLHNHRSGGSISSTWTFLRILSQRELKLSSNNWNNSKTLFINLKYSVTKRTE